MPRPERRLRKLANVSELAMMIFATFSPETLFFGRWNGLSTLCIDLLISAALIAWRWSENLHSIHCQDGGV
jgi:hypothetical protein